MTARRHAIAVLVQERSAKFGEPFGAVLEVAEDGVPMGGLQRDSVEISVDARLEDVGRCDSIVMSVRVEAGDDPSGVVRSDRCPVQVEHAIKHTPMEAVTDAPS